MQAEHYPSKLYNIGYTSNNSWNYSVKIWNYDLKFVYFLKEMELYKNNKCSLQSRCLIIVQFWYFVHAPN